MLKNILNQFERDWAEAPLRDKNLDLSKLINKNIAVSGNSMITRAIALALLSINDIKSCNNKVFVFSEKPDLFDIVSDRNDVKIINHAAADFSVKTDIWIETGFLADDCKFEPENSGSVFLYAESVIKHISYNPPRNLLLISDNSIYGSLKRGFVVSENEIGSIDLGCDDLHTIVMQSVENIFNSAAHQYNFNCKILRSPAIVSSFSNSSFIKNLISYVTDDSNELIFDSNITNSISFIGINDFITAVFYVIIYGDNTAYNACSRNSSVTLSELAVMVKDLFGKDIKFEPNINSISGCAVADIKLKNLGWSPVYDIKDALLIAKYAYLNSEEIFMFPDAYDGKLEAVQKILLGFLLEIDRICKKHNIKYFLAGGTLLGAVRHKGFIPWDDDADVMMLREDYDKFLSVLPDELPSNLFSQNSEKTSHFPFLKIRIKNTVFSTEFTSHFNDVSNGIFFDVLAQDKTSNNKLMRKLHMKLTASSRWLVLNKWRGTPVDANNRFSSFVANVLKRLFTLRFLEKSQNYLIAKYKNKQDAKYLFDSMGRNITRGEFPACWLDESILVDFEGVKLPIPKEYDKYLTYLYGDYMDMIPVSLRHVSHDIIQMDLGEYTNFHLD